MMELLFHVQIGGIFEIFVDEIDLRESRFLVILLLIYSVTWRGLMSPHNASLDTIAIGGRRQRNWCVHNLFICAFSHTFGSHIHNLWHRSVDHLLNSTLLKTLMENNMHHSDYLFHERLNRNVPVDGTIATITGCLNWPSVKLSFHHVNDMAGGQWSETTKEQL